MKFPPPPPPATPPRVVVTGAGIVTALGVGWQANAEGFRAGRTAFRRVTLFDVSRHRVKTAAQVDLPPVLPPTQLSARQLARLDRASMLLLLAAGEAWQQAGWERTDDLPVVLGTTSGGMLLGEEYFRQAVRTPRRHRQPAHPRLSLPGPDAGTHAPRRVGHQWSDHHHLERLRFRLVRRRPCLGTDPSRPRRARLCRRL